MLFISLYNDLLALCAWMHFFVGSNGFFFGWAVSNTGVLSTCGHTQNFLLRAGSFGTNIMAYCTVASACSRQNAGVGQGFCFFFVFSIGVDRVSNALHVLSPSPNWRTGTIRVEGPQAKCFTAVICEIPGQLLHCPQVEKFLHFLINIVLCTHSSPALTPVSPALILKWLRRIPFNTWRPQKRKRPFWTAPVCENTKRKKNSPLFHG